MEHNALVGSSGIEKFERLHCGITRMVFQVFLVLGPTRGANT